MQVCELCCYRREHNSHINNETLHPSYFRCKQSPLYCSKSPTGYITTSTSDASQLASSPFCYIRRHLMPGREGEWRERGGVEDTGEKRKNVILRRFPVSARSASSLPQKCFHFYNCGTKRNALVCSVLRRHRN
jgi:hypothetical protein